MLVEITGRQIAHKEVVENLKLGEVLTWQSNISDLVKIEKLKRLAKS